MDKGGRRTRCPLCARRNPREARFCMGCGASLAGASLQAAGAAAEVRRLDALLPVLKRYLPQALYAPLERRPAERNLIQVRDHLLALLRTTRTYLPAPVVETPQPAGVPQGRMSQGTFLFVDVTGSTALTEILERFGQAGAEHIAAIMNNLFFRLVSVLFRHGGVLLKFGGDALLGLFPGDRAESLAAGALRAVQAGIAMQAAMQEFAAVKAAGGEVALRIRAGISSGAYFAAHIGTRRSMAYVTTGHTVSRAELAEHHARPGELIITQSTNALLERQVRVERRGDGLYAVQDVAPLAEELTWHLPEETLPAELGAQLGYLADRLQHLVPYLQREILARISADPGPCRISPEYRPVTVMFVNYVGLSDLIEQAGATRSDLIARHTNSYFAHMARVVEHYDGVIARMDNYSVGDRLVIFFGAPRAHEDDPVRAIHAALDMQEVTRKSFSALRTPDGVFRFQQRIGISTGQLFAGNVGALDLRQEYTLMGDDINTAAHLMAKAEWRQIFISRKTQERVAAHFHLKEEGALRLKGKERPVTIFQVLGRREEVRRTRGLSSGESPFIGRAEELRTLRLCADALLRGRGQIVALISDSGVGKSRLLREMRGWLPSQQRGADVLWVVAQAISFREQVSYFIAAQLLQWVLKSGSGGDPLGGLWERCETLLGKETAREAVPLLAHLLDIQIEGEWARWARELEPRVRQKQTLWATREIFAAQARRQPVVLVVDDLHWADEASLALLEDLLDVTDQAPLMLCLLMRPLRDRGCWRLRDRAAAMFPHRYTELQLRPLPDDESKALLAALLPDASFQEAALQKIIDKAAGNPFYLEEFVRTLIEGGAVVPAGDRPGRWQVRGTLEQVTVPDSLQGAIMARIDRLTASARKALLMASVIGRQFQLEILRTISGAEAAIELWISQLERSDFVRQARQGVEPIYMFLDALVQEVAYSTLIMQERQEFHRRIGERLEEQLGQAAAQECELLCYHFSRSADTAKAIRYLEIAGRKAQAEFANETALQRYSDLLALICDKESMWRLRLDILRCRQQVYGLLARQDERRADLNAMHSLSMAHDDEASRAHALIGLADLSRWTGRYAEALDYANQALALTTRLGDVVGQADALHQIGALQYYQGQYGAAQLSLGRAVSLCDGADERNGAESWSAMYLGMIDFAQGRYSEASRHHAHALALAELRRDWLRQGIYLTNAARVSLRLGQYEDALAKLARSMELKTRVGDRIGQGFTLFGQGAVYLCLGLHDKAQEAMESSMRIRRQSNDERGMGYSLYGLGRVALALSQWDKAVGLFQQAGRICAQLGLMAERALALSYQARARLGAGDLSAATEESSEAMVMLEKLSNVEEVQGVYFNHFLVLSASEDPDAAGCLQRAYDVMMHQAAYIDDPARRRSFLERVPVNRSILAEVATGIWRVQISSPETTVLSA